jgi:hypothetical protein
MKEDLESSSLSSSPLLLKNRDIGVFLADDMGVWKSGFKFFEAWRQSYDFWIYNYNARAVRNILERFFEI